jgi:chemotaxis protein CheX
MAELLTDEYVDKLEEATRDVFQTMIPVPFEFVGKAETFRHLRGERISILSFTGTHRGSFVIATTENGAKAITAALLMMEEEELASEDEEDALGELANMVGGNFKNYMIERGMEMHLATPVVLSGNSMKGHADREASLGFALRFSVKSEDLVVTFQFVD